MDLEGNIEEVKKPCHDNNWDLVQLRSTHYNYLQLTDKYFSPDYPITMKI